MSHPSLPGSTPKRAGPAHLLASRTDSNRSWTTDLSKKPLDQWQGGWSGENPHVDGA